MSILLEKHVKIIKVLSVFQATRWALNVSGWNKYLEKSPLCFAQLRLLGQFCSFSDVCVCVAIKTSKGLVVLGRRNKKSFVLNGAFPLLSWSLLKWSARNFWIISDTSQSLEVSFFNFFKFTYNFLWPTSNR